MRLQLPNKLFCRIFLNLNLSYYFLYMGTESKFAVLINL